MLDGALEWTERLRPRTVRAAVPEQPRTARGRDQRHGSPARGANTDTEPPIILKLPIRQMTRRAGHAAIHAETAIKEYSPAERGGQRVGRIAVRWIGGETPKLRERERL